MLATESPPLALWIAHQDAIFRRGLKSALNESRLRFEVGMVDPAATKIDSLASLVGVLITDTDTGVVVASAQRRLATARTLRIVVLGGSRERHDVATVIECGVRGYLLPGFPLDALTDAIHTVSRGMRYLCRGAAQRMLEINSRELLTSRELEVLRYVMGGHSNKEIAIELDIAVGTVKAHVKSVFSKFDVGSRTEAACVATERGIAPLRRMHRISRLSRRLESSTRHRISDALHQLSNPT